MSRCLCVHIKHALQTLTWNIMYPESYIQKSSGVCPGLLSWMAKQCCNIRRHLCGVPGDFVPIVTSHFVHAKVHSKSLNSISYSRRRTRSDANVAKFSALVNFSTERIVVHSRLVFSRRFHCHDWNEKRINNIELVECPAHPNKMKQKEAKKSEDSVAVDGCVLRAAIQKWPMREILKK